MYYKIYSDAKRDGETIYQGTQCRECGEVLRYVVNGACINRAKHHRDLMREPKTPTAREIAAANNLIRFRGKQCRCGGTERYTANGGCVACCDARAKQFQVNKRVKFVSPEGLPVIWLNERSKNRAELYEKIGYPDWHLAFSTTPIGRSSRLRTGRDVLERVGDFAPELNAMLRGETSPLIEALRPILPVANESMRMFNARKSEDVDTATYTATLDGVVYSKTLGQITRLDERPMLPHETIQVMERATWSK